MNRPCGQPLPCHSASPPGLLTPGWGWSSRLASPQEERGRTLPGHPLPFPTVHALLHAPNVPETAPCPSSFVPSSISQILGPGDTARSVEVWAQTEGSACPCARLHSLRQDGQEDGRSDKNVRCFHGAGVGQVRDEPVLLAGTMSTHRCPVPRPGASCRSGSGAEVSGRRPAAP